MRVLGGLGNKVLIGGTLLVQVSEPIKSRLIEKIALISKQWFQWATVPGKGQIWRVWLFRLEVRTSVVGGLLPSQRSTTIASRSQYILPTYILSGEIIETGLRSSIIPEDLLLTLSV
jgi:hypothetical protein